MTVAEQRFLEQVPRRLDGIEGHLERISRNLERLTEVMIKMYGEPMES